MNNISWKKNTECHMYIIYNGRYTGMKNLLKVVVTRDEEKKWNVYIFYGKITEGTFSEKDLRNRTVTRRQWNKY